MTNDTIDHDARVTRAPVVRPQRNAAVCADLDAAPIPIRAPSPWAPTAVQPNVRNIRHEVSADGPSRPLGAASTTTGPGWRESRPARQSPDPQRRDQHHGKE